MTGTAGGRRRGERAGATRTCDGALALRRGNRVGTCHGRAPQRASRSAGEPGGPIIPQFDDTQTVRRVFYLPGFDQRDPETYWGLFRRESRLTAQRRDMTILVGDAVRATDGISLDWTVDTTADGARTRTHYALLRWEDIVRDRFPRANARRMVDGARLGWRLWRGGYFRAFAREARQFSTVIVGVHILYLVLVALSLALAALAVAATPLPTASPVLAGLGAAVLAYPILGVLTRVTKGRPFYIAHLVDDTAFTHDHGSGAEPAMRARLEAWAARIHAAEAAGGEIVVIGHSSSSFLAIEALDRILARDPAFGTRGTPVSLVTLGGVISWITLDPLAEDVRAAIGRFANARSIAWLDLRANWDWLSIHLRSPLAALGLPAIGRDRPVTKWLQIEDLVEPGQIFGAGYNLFRMHFQLLMSSRARDTFDYIDFVAGPVPVFEAIEEIRAGKAGARTSPVAVSSARDSLSR